MDRSYFAGVQSSFETMTRSSKAEVQRTRISHDSWGFWGWITIFLGKVIKIKWFIILYFHCKYHIMLLSKFGAWSSFLAISLFLGIILMEFLNWESSALLFANTLKLGSQSRWQHIIKLPHKLFALKLTLLYLGYNLGYFLLTRVKASYFRKNDDLA